MSLKKRIYSVLIVSAKPAINSALMPLFPESAYAPVHTTASISAAKRALAERSFDFVLINSPLPDDAGIRFAIDTCLTRSSVVLLLVKSNIHDEIYDKVAEHGVFTLPRPTSKAVMLQALNWMASARERLRRFERETLSIEKKMEEIRLVNRAKWLLISERGMAEADAHHYIEKLAMDNCVSRLEIARDILRSRL